MVKSKNRIVRFLDKYVFRNLLICLLCVSSVVGLTACCYPSAITRSATDAGGYSELDYLNSMFSGAMVLTSLTADELTSDYLFYDSQGKGADTDHSNKELHSYFNLADRQFTVMAKYLQRMVDAMYASFDSEANFLWWSWDKTFDILNPSIWTNDPNCVYTNNISTYYKTALLSNPEQPNNSKKFQINHFNEYFQYACSKMDGCNYDFTNAEKIKARLRIYNNATNYSEEEKSPYKSNASDTTGKIQIAPIWIPDEGRYHYYVVSNLRNEDGTPQSRYSDIHLYDVLNANAVALDSDQNTDNSHFLWWSWDESYDSATRENKNWTCSSGSWADYKENAPNVKNFSWNDAGYYTYTYGFQTGNGLVKNTSGKESDDCGEIRKVKWHSTNDTGSKTYWLGKGTSVAQVDTSIFGIEIKFGESYNYGKLYSSKSDAENGSNSIGNYVQGWYNSYFEVFNQKTVKNINFNYFMYNNLFFPVDGNKTHPYGSVHEVITGKITKDPIFNSSASIPYYSKESTRRGTNVYLVVQIDSTDDVTKVFDHNMYYGDYAGNKKSKTIKAWQRYNQFTTKKVKYALAALSRYGSYDKVKSAYGGDFGGCLSKKQYKLNIANGKSIGLSQALYSGMIDYMKYYIIGKGNSFFDSYYGSSRSEGWLWQKSIDSMEKYLGETGTTPYAEIFAANNNKSEMSLYKAYDFIIPRVVGSIFSLYNTSSLKPYFSTRIDICNALINGTFDTDNSYFNLNTTLFPTVVSARIYTYGNISTLNRLYNYEMGIDYAPFDVEETEGKDFENYEGYQDKIGRYLYLYDNKNAFKDNPEAPAVKIEKTLQEFLYGIDKADKKYNYEGTEYYLPTHKGVLDVVTDAKMQSLILFPKVTKDPDTNNPATKPDNEYGEYICVDPTFITSMIGKEASSETYVRMSVEIAGSYTYDDATGRVKAVTDPATGEHRVFSYGQSYNHSKTNTTIDAKGNFTTNEVTQFLHVKGNEYYTDLAVMQVDKDDNVIRVGEKDNIPRYYSASQVDGYGKYTGSTPLTGEEAYNFADAKFFDNYSREVYIYTDDYLYFKNGLPVNSSFSLYKWIGSGSSAEKKINDQYFYADHDDKIWTSPFTNYRVKYNAYKVRSNLFEPLVDGYSLNPDVVSSYIRIDFSYYEDSGLTQSLDNTTYTAASTDANPSSMTDAQSDNDVDDFTDDHNKRNYTTSYSTKDPVITDPHSIDRDDAKKYGFSLSTKEVDFHLFETGIYAVDCGEELMQEQDNTDFPVDMVGDYVVEFVDYSSKESIFSMGVDAGQNLSSSSAFANYFGTGGRLMNGSWQIGDSYYKANRYKRGSGSFYSIANLKNVVISGDTTIYLELVKVKNTLTYDYTQLFSSYSDYIPNSTLTKYPNTASRQITQEYDKGIQVVPSTDIVNIGEAIAITGWKVYVGAETSPSSTIDTTSAISIMNNVRIVPVVSSNKFMVKLNPNGGKFGDGSTDERIYYVEADKKVSSNATVSSMSNYPNVTHPEGYTFKGWSKTGFENGIESFSEFKNFTVTTEDVTYYAVWDISTVKVSVSYVSNGDSMYSGYDDVFRIPKNNLDRNIASYDTSLLSNKVNDVKSEIEYGSIENYVKHSSSYYKFMGFTPSYGGTSKLGSARDTSIQIVLSNGNVSTSSYYTSNNIFNSSTNTGISLSGHVSNSELTLSAVYQKLYKVRFVLIDGGEYVFYVAPNANLNSDSNFVVNKSALNNLTGEDLSRWSLTYKPAAEYTKSHVKELSTIKSTAVTGDVTYYQIKDNISVTYYNKTGSVYATESYLAGETITDKPLISGSTGWSTSSTSENIVKPSDYIGTKAGSYTFYAWSTFTITYHYSGTTYVETVSGSNTPQGHSAANVIGWSTSQTSESTVNPASYKNHGSNVNLYAVYQYSASFSWHGGSTSKTDKATYASNSVTFTMPATPGDYTDSTSGKKYTFDYWSVNGSKHTSSSWTGSGNITVVAVYKEVVETPPAG